MGDFLITTDRSFNHYNNYEEVIKDIKRKASKSGKMYVYKLERVYDVNIDPRVTECMGDNN